MSLSENFRLGLSPKFRGGLTLLMLAGSTMLPRCSCDDDIAFEPGAEYTPTTLNFGNVSVGDAVSLTVKVSSIGSASLRIERTEVSGADSGKFTVDVAPELLAGLGPGGDALITVTYRPCPEAWKDGKRDPAFNLDDCTLKPDSGTLVVNDNTPQQTREISLGGIGVLPPTIEAYCNPVGCGMEPMRNCQGISILGRTVSDPPCDIIVELKNSFRPGMNGEPDQPVGTLLVERLDIVVNDILTNQPVNAEDVGFSILSMDDQPLSPTSANPFEVPIDPGSTSGTARFKLRFTAVADGTFSGASMDGEGLRIYSNGYNLQGDRVEVLNITTTGNSVTPDLQVFPRDISFGPVPENTTKTITATVSNRGSAPLSISSITVEPATSEIVLRATDNRMLTNIQLAGFGLGDDEFGLAIDYTPMDPGSDSYTIVFNSDDPNENPLRIPVFGGAIPNISITPPDTLTFPTGQGARTRDITITNSGFGLLQISHLAVKNSMVPETVDDFAIDLPDCTTTPTDCAVNVSVCPAQTPNCGGGAVNELVVPITFNNNDISTTDLANFEITSNDPDRATAVVVLSAEDIPCFFPDAIIELETMRPCIGQPVTINASMSMANGRIGMNDAITAYEWSFGFVTGGQTPTFNATDQVTATFTPTVQGLHEVNLRVQNTCGRWSDVTAIEPIIVSQSCQE